MATARFLTNAERERLEAFPRTISRDDIATYYTLSRREPSEVRRLRGDGNRLRSAIGLGAVRLLGLLPNRLDTVSVEVMQFVSDQVALPPRRSSRPGEVLEHTTDTAGYTDLVFALFDLLGMRFAPRSETPRRLGAIDWRAPNAAGRISSLRGSSSARRSRGTGTTCCASRRRSRPDTSRLRCL